MSIDNYADLIHDFRTALEEQSGLTLPALRPPIEETELERYEDRMRVELPESLKDLLRVANGLQSFSAFAIGFCDPLGDFFVQKTEMVRDLHHRIEEGEYSLDARHWYGMPPHGEIVVFGRHDQMDAVIEVGGPLDGRVTIWEGNGAPGFPMCWREIGGDIETVLRWSLDLARSNNELGQPFDVRTSQYGDEQWVGLSFKARMEPWDELDDVREILENYDVGPAVFGHYDPPPSYLYPVEPQRR